MEAQIIEAYKELVIAGDEKINAFSIAKKVGITEQEFFKFFSSADDVGRKIWANIGDEVFGKLNDSETYQNYSSREKLLTYFFTFFEVALNHRLFVEATVHSSRLLKTYKEKYKQFTNDIVQEGIASEEIKERLSISNYYPDMLWNLHVQLVNFWLDDTSEHFVETDKAIEVYSKIPLEFMGHNLLDSVFETLKFGFEQIRTEKMNFDRFKFGEKINQFIRKQQA